MTEQQPMKMAAAEALYETAQPARRSRSSRSAPFEAHPNRSSFDVNLPTCCRSWPRTPLTARSRASTRSSRVRSAKYGPGDYRPVHRRHLLVVPAHDRPRRRARSLLAALRAAGSRDRGTLETSRWFLRLATCGDRPAARRQHVGWIFTEMGRQPWVVFGPAADRERRVAERVRPGRSRHLADRFTLLYGVLAVVEVGSCSATRSRRRRGRRADRARRRPTPPLAFAY